ncbi:MAG: hypothetical protein E3J86_07245 [Candidatus Thorarchaeota archaeon]|nr:MAG: hypothetical protein E3J86_07245 [Candidatus Thorarchaeota archaeon]
MKKCIRAFIGTSKIVFRAVRRRDILFWAVASLASVVGGLILQPALIHQETMSRVNAMISIDTMAYVFTLCIPILLGAGILLTTEDVRQSFAEQYDSGSREGVMWASSIALLIVLAATFSVALTVGVFLFSELSSQISMAAYIPGAALASFIVTLILCPVGMMLTLALDDWKLSTVAGSALFLIIAFGTGMPSSPARYPELALLGPVQYFRAVASSLAGVEFLSPLDMVNSFGVYFTSELLIVPSIVLSVLSVLSLWVSRRLFEQNLLMWRLELSPWSDQVIPEDEKIDLQEKMTRIKKERKRFKRNALSILVLLIFIIPPIGYGYTVYREVNDLTILYEGEHNLPNGQWLYQEFSTTRPPIPQGMLIRYEIDILDWGESPDNLIRQHGCLKMTLADFESMNDGERFYAGFASGSGLIKPETRDRGSYGVSLYDDMSHMVWAMRFVDSNWNITSGVLTFSIRVLLVITP